MKNVRLVRKGKETIFIEHSVIYFIRIIFIEQFMYISHLVLTTLVGDVIPILWLRKLGLIQVQVICCFWLIEPVFTRRFCKLPLFPHTMPEMKQLGPVPFLSYCCSTKI